MFKVRTVNDAWLTKLVGAYVKEFNALPRALLLPERVKLWGTIAATRAPNGGYGLPKYRSHFCFPRSSLAAPPSCDWTLASVEGGIAAATRANDGFMALASMRGQSRVCHSADNGGGGEVHWHAPAAKSAGHRPGLVLPRFGGQALGEIAQRLWREST